MVFVSTYPNDAQTIAEVERMRRRYKRMRRIEVPHDGPTSKADCLNWLVLAIFEYEKQNDIKFAGVVLHDSQDVLHPMEQRFFNHLLPRKDMIQLPVTSLDREWYELVAGVYMDEFAEWHTKDLVVRESVSGMVPSAGVGTCFSRKALLALSQASNNQPFNPDSLTEDYDVGARLAAMGMHSIFARFPVQFRVRRPSWFGWGPVRERTLHMALCVREYFPDNFRASYRQKARWVLGIGPAELGDAGLARFAGDQVPARARPQGHRHLVRQHLRLSDLPAAVAVLAAQGRRHVGHPVPDHLPERHLADERGAADHCGAGHARGAALLLRQPPVRLGTRADVDPAHGGRQYDQLHVYRTRLGELLTTWEAVEPERLAQELRQQEGGRQQPLGRILVAQGWLDDETLAEAIAFQGDLPRAAIDVAYLQAGRFQLSVQACVQLRLLHDLDASVLRQAIARESEINAGLRLISGESYRVDAVPLLLGDLLVELRLIARDQFERVLDQYKPQRDDHLVKQGVTTQAAIAAAVREQHRRAGQPHDGIGGALQA